MRTRDNPENSTADYSERNEISQYLVAHGVASMPDGCLQEPENRGGYFVIHNVSSAYFNGNVGSRRVPRSTHEHARDKARAIAKSSEGRVSRRLRKRVEMLFAHLKRILKLDRLRLRGPNGARDEFLLAATAKNLRKLAKLIPIRKPEPA